MRKNIMTTQIKDVNVTPLGKRNNKKKLTTIIAIKIIIIFEWFY